LSANKKYLEIYMRSNTIKRMIVSHAKYLLKHGHISSPLYNYYLATATGVQSFREFVSEE